MLFHSFNSQQERSAFGGSAFIEMQFCKLPAQTRVDKIVSVHSIKNWQNDSLYVHVDDIDLFCREYSRFFDRGVYNNLNSGAVDVYGINYYSPTLIDSIIERIRSGEPAEHEALVAWLGRAKLYNGFYILGL